MLSCVTILLKGQVLADALVDEVFDLAKLLGAHLLEVREVEAQIVGCHERALLTAMTRVLCTLL